jgi:hypothetical protein
MADNRRGVEIAESLNSITDHSLSEADCYRQHRS